MLELGSEVAFAGSHNHVFAVFDPDVDAVEKAVSMEGLRTIKDAVLRTELVADVLKRLGEVFHFEGE